MHHEDYNAHIALSEAPAPCGGYMYRPGKTQPGLFWRVLRAVWGWL